MKCDRLRAALVVLLFRSLGDRPQEHAAAQQAAPLDHTVNLNDRTGDTFKVTLAADDLGPGNAVYQFAATTPGTYQMMNIGRFVRSFEAVDAAGAVIPSEHITTNQWRISDPQRVAIIR